MKFLFLVASANYEWLHNCASISLSIAALAGLALLINWTLKTGFGTKALDSAVFRPNLLSFYTVFTILFGWLGVTLFASDFIRKLPSNLPNWQRDLILYSVLVVIEVVIMVFVLASAKRFFQSGLAGLGLGRDGIFSDITSAFAMFIAVWPLVMIVLYVIVLVGKSIAGADFKVEQNEGLAVLLQYDQWSIRLLMIFFAAILTPVFEELLFRGLLQSYLRSIGLGPWRSIFASSIIFTLLHPLMHFPALIILSIAMGYAYEKSGSLLRCIFIHFFFNASTIAFALLN
ncbi:MAG: CPBP family intramembrane metalloprotease [Phycisphaerae bacterium]|nr:CPBP family intramembrane metalloprotease [Phycisphaerae bacterium]